MNFNDLDNLEYEKQLNYFKKYYGSSFREGQGTEKILDMINIFSNSGSLIDFGSGSNIYFWLTAFKHIENVLCIDISKESFYINEQIRKKELYPVSCEYSLKKYKKNFDDILETNIRYKILDVLNSEIDNDIKYNNVSQFGLLGLCKNKKEYISNLNKLCNLLNINGILFGANWHFSLEYSKQKEFTNDYLTPSMINEYANKKNLHVLKSEIIPIVDDNNYDYVLIYALKNE